MKNYYELLEVNPKASKEVIEKAYKVLVKKYHPDLNMGERKKYAEKKIKEINEAYDVLSNEFLKEQYDIELEKEDAKKVQNKYEEERKKNEIEKNKEEVNFEEKLQNSKVGSFSSIVLLTKKLIYDLAKSKEKREEFKADTKKNIIAIILTIIIVLIIGIILWFIPFTNVWVRELLFENPIFNWIGNLFK